MGLVLILLFIGGAYWYLRDQPANNAQPAAPKSTAQPATESFDEDLNSIDVQTQDTDFDALDKDLQSL